MAKKTAEDSERNGVQSNAVQKLQASHACLVYIQLNSAAFELEMQLLTLRTTCVVQCMKGLSDVLHPRNVRSRLMLLSTHPSL